MGELVIFEFMHLQFCPRTDRNNEKISKYSPDVFAAMEKFASLITVMNLNKNHWITLRFLPKNKILEVFDSLQSEDFSSSKKKYEKVSPYRIHRLKLLTL
jgi:hypothetical protein